MRRGRTAHTRTDTQLHEWGAVRLVINPHTIARLQKRRRMERGEAFRDRDRWRAGVEATRSRFKDQLEMARLRVQRIANITYVATRRAFELNLRRVTAYRSAVGQSTAVAAI